MSCLPIFVSYLSCFITLTFAIHALNRYFFFCGLACVAMPLSPIPWFSIHATNRRVVRNVILCLLFATLYTIFIMSVVRAASMCRIPMPSTKGVCNGGAQIFAARQNASFMSYLLVANRRKFRQHDLRRDRNSITHLNELRC